MYSTIKAGGKEIPVVSNAATAFIFKQAFKLDLLTYLTQEHADGEMTEIALKLFYVMAKQAEVPTMSELLKTEMNEMTFVEYISVFELSEVSQLAIEAFKAWNGNAETSADDEGKDSPKKKTAKAAK